MLSMPFRICVPESRCTCYSLLGWLLCFEWFNSVRPLPRRLQLRIFERVSCEVSIGIVFPSCSNQMYGVSGRIKVYQPI